MTELQTGDSEHQVEATSASSEPVESVNQNSGSATETQPEDNGNVQKRINKITAEKYAVIREKEQMAKELEALKSQPQQSVTQSESSIKAPELPSDIYDEDAMKKYHRDVASYSVETARSEAVNSAKSVFEQQQEQARQLQHKQDQNKIISSYAERGFKAGLTQEQMQINEQVLNGSGIGADLGLFIMQDENGAQIADYLANTPEALAEINTMSPTMAAVKLANEIKPKAVGARNVTSAPDPVEGIRGGSGAKEIDDFDRLCPGATFS